jgi:hypothetical protein
VLCTQFVGVKCRVPNFLLKAPILATRRPCHRNGTRRCGPIYSPTYAANGSVLLALPAAMVPASLITIAFALNRIEREPGAAADPRSGREKGGRPRHGQAGHQDPGGTWRTA